MPYGSMLAVVHPYGVPFHMEVVDVVVVVCCCICRSRMQVPGQMGSKLWAGRRMPPVDRTRGRFPFPRWRLSCCHVTGGNRGRDDGMGKWRVHDDDSE